VFSIRRISRLISKIKSLALKVMFWRRTCVERLQLTLLPCTCFVPRLWRFCTSLGWLSVLSEYENNTHFLLLPRLWHFGPFSSRGLPSLLFLPSLSGEVSRQIQVLQGGVVSPTPNPPTWKTRVSHSVLVTTFDLFGMGAPASSHGTADIALRSLWPEHVLWFH
jgi:hypothetical protein